MKAQFVYDKLNEWKEYKELSNSAKKMIENSTEIIARFGKRGGLKSLSLNGELINFTHSIPGKEMRDMYRYAEKLGKEIQDEFEDKYYTFKNI